MLDRNRKANRWEDSASLARFVPSELAVPWLPVADEVSFALGRLHRTDAAVELRAPVGGPPADLQVEAGRRDR